MRMSQDKAAVSIMDIQTQVQTLLNAAFSPEFLEVINESAQHAGHAGARPGGQTHFRVKMRATAFAGLSRVQRHQKVYGVLAKLMNNPIHALALELEAAK